MKALAVGAVLLLCCYLPSSADELPSHIATPDKLLLTDDFSRTELGDHWEFSRRAFAIQEGKLVCVRSPGGGHGDIAGTLVDFCDAIIELRFRFEGVERFHVVVDDREYAGSHAGHICRVTVLADLVRLADDKTGGMRNDIVQLRQQPGGREKAAPLLEGKSTSAPIALEQGRWYRLTVEIVGDTMLALIDGRPVVMFASEGVAHETKRRIHFTVEGDVEERGPAIHFDDLKVWSATAVK